MIKTYVSFKDGDVQPELAGALDKHKGINDCKYPGCGGVLMMDIDEEVRCILCDHEHDEEGNLIMPQPAQPHLLEHLHYARRRGKRL